MCLSDLGRVIGVDSTRHTATVEIAGRPVDVSTVALGLDAPTVAPGEWLVVHTGLAVERLDDDEARQILVERERFATATGPQADPGGAAT